MLRAKPMVAAAIAALALTIPTTALATPGNGKGHGQGTQAGPNYQTAPPPKGNAYGRYCQGESKKHVKGEKGTAFSRCVRTMSQAAKNDRQPPGRVCKGKSKKHVKGEKGTEFSRCVKAVAKLRRDEKQRAQP